MGTLNFIIAVLLVVKSNKKMILKKETYLFSSNQLSTLVLASRGSPKLLGLEEVIQNIGLSVHKILFVSFLFLRSLYS